MSVNMDGSLEHIQIQPSNVVSSQSVSFRNGNPVVQFIIGETDKYLIGKSLRLTGNIQFFDNSAVPVNASKLNVDGKLGVYSVISKLDIKSQRSKQTIETINHYGRFLATYLPYLSTIQESIGHAGETTCMMPNFEVERQGLVNNQNGVSATNRTTTGSSFCLNLPCGILNETIPLSAKWGVGGLILEITLQNDSQALFATSGSGADLTSPFYQLSNLNLVAEVVNPSAENLSMLSNQQGNTMEYNSISSYYTSVNSTNAQINFNLGLSKCLGAFFNTIPSAQLNNLAFNGNSCLPFTNGTAGAGSGVADLRQVIFTRNGTKYPLQYNLDTNVNPKFMTAGTTYYPADPQIVRNVLDSFMPFEDNKRTQVSPLTFTRDLNASFTDNDLADGGSMFAVGVAFDSISNQGIDFSTANLGISMEIDLTSDNPQTIFLFVHHKNTLVFNQNGLQVIN